MREINCKELSSDAQKIFEKIKMFFPPDKRGKSRSDGVGRVFARNLLCEPRWYDLRKSREIASLMFGVSRLIDQWLDNSSTLYRVNHGSMKGFGRQRFNKSVESLLELKWLLIDMMAERYDSNYRDLTIEATK
ncbi:MAG: hypothetical protein HY226_01515 [Candidatus Vogelbacteria bacterium]|nr:hypothetical protein [Candidatus Vogelbacteria bacterium]